MRLAPFIQANMEPILAEWEAFANTLYPPSSQMTPLLLRDHAEQILDAVVADLSTTQTRAEQSQKSMGRARKASNAPETAAQTHAVLRAQSGIDINQLAAEYRALRASVLRLWEQAYRPATEDLQDIIRFNEAIDQALAESIGHFSARVERSRNFLLGMLGHDMRNPLNAIVMTASNLAELNAGEEVSEAAASLIRSGSSMKALLDDLLDFNRTNLGLGIKINLGDAELGSLFAEEVKQHQTAAPKDLIEFTVNGNTRGRWDGQRLQQVLRNLLSNAFAYGAKEDPVHVALDGTGTGISFEVRNRGSAIDPAKAEQLFDPLNRGGAEGHIRSNSDGLGLGLYIVREIVHAHGGEVGVRSHAGHTVFTVHLPRDSGSLMPLQIIRRS
jgi:signal transduction histidine kinase